MFVVCDVLCSVVWCVLSLFNVLVRSVCSFIVWCSMACNRFVCLWLSVVAFYVCVFSLKCIVCFVWCVCLCVIVWL